MRIGLLFCGIVCFSILAEADTTYVDGGDVSGVWEAEHSPYFVLANIRIPLGDSLRIEAGVEVRFSDDVEFNNSGRLRVAGTALEPVRFHSLGCWRGIQIWGTTELQEIDYAIIEKVGLLSPFGAFYCIGCSLEVRNSSIRNGVAVGGRALYATTAAVVKFIDCEIMDNEQGCGCGGAIKADALSRVELRGCRVKNNSATDGGAFCMYQSELILEDCLIENNHSAVWGGAIYAEGFDFPMIVDAADCLFRGNHSAESGVYYGWATDTMTQAAFRGCQFIENYAGGDYSNVSAIAPVRVLNLDRCTFSGNGPGPGGVVRVMNGQATITNSIFANTSSGVALFRAGGAWQIRHCDFYGNASGNANANAPGGFGVVNHVNANGDSCDQYLNLFLDPQFADTATNDCHLTAGSPCIDAGDPVSPPDPDGSVADIGALYYSQLDAPDRERAAVRRYELGQNYPNPFNATTTISFALPSAGEVRLNVFDITGRVVATVAEGVYAAGAHRVRFDAGALPSGIYVYRLQAKDFSQSRKLVLLK